MASIPHRPAPPRPPPTAAGEDRDADIARQMLAAAVAATAGFLIGRAGKSGEGGRARREAGDAHTRSIVATMPDGMVVADRRGVILSVNPAAERMFGWSAAELVGRNVTVLMRDRDAAEHPRYVRRYLDTKERRLIGYGRAMIAERRDGSQFPIEITVGEDWSDRHIFTAFIRDLEEQAIAERRVEELRAELAQASRQNAMAALGSTLAHEVNQPIANVANYVESVRHMLAGSAEIDLAVIDAALREAAAEALRAGDIIRHLRDLAARGDVEKSIEDLGILVREAASIALNTALVRGYDLRIAVPPALVLVDRVQIQQVLINLIRNAREAMAEGERRELTVASAPTGDGSVQVSVADSGPGIAPEIADRLFDAFSSTKADGMGLGLSICRTIVESNGGRIWTEPRPGGGTVFHFTLPLARGPAHG